ncbi:MAG: Arc family DNA-binding protein [Thiothrix sp.]|nr:MAG: Arc family DNA-binding protein [Thiothrix sp.]
MQKQTQVRMKPEVHAWLIEQAQANNRSMNGQINEIFLQAMKQAEKAAKRAKPAEQAA